MNAHLHGTAVITGASSGIGRAVAVELASRGFDVLVTGRDGGKLKALAENLTTEFGIRAEFFAADLAVPEARKALIAAIERHDVRLLVNNAGFAVKGEFAETELGDELALTEVQIAAALDLTKAVLRQMRPRRSGIILNVGSVYSFSPVPQQAVYAACKSFLYSFSASLRSELQGQGIKVSILSPGITRTEFRQRAGIADKPGAGISAEAAAKAGVEGALKGKFLIVPGIQNKLFVFLTRHLPPSLSAALIRRINSRRGLGKS